MKALVSSDKLPAPAGPYSPGLTVGEWIFLSGQGGFDPNTGTVVSADLPSVHESTPSSNRLCVGGRGLRSPETL